MMKIAGIVVAAKEVLAIIAMTVTKEGTAVEKMELPAMVIVPNPQSMPFRITQKYIIDASLLKEVSAMSFSRFCI